MITSSKFDKILTLKHAFFTREDGISSGVFSGLNCGYGSGDETANVDKNRDIAMAKLGLGRDQLNTLYQIHSTEVAVADRQWSLQNRPKADGLVANRPGIAIGIMTADCTPVLFADPKAGVIGAAHAGWKGAIGGVLPNTVQKMEDLGADRAHIIAVVGPCIHQASYEVGPEFRAQFIKENLTNDRYFVPSSKAGHALFDLPQFVLDKLANLGLSAVQNASVDTYVNETQFYSYRRATHRAEEDYGRGLSAIVLNKE